MSWTALNYVIDLPSDVERVLHALLPHYIVGGLALEMVRAQAKLDGFGVRSMYMMGFNDVDLLFSTKELFDEAQNKLLRMGWEKYEEGRMEMTSVKKLGGVKFKKPDNVTFDLLCGQVGDVLEFDLGVNRMALDWTRGQVFMNNDDFLLLSFGESRVYRDTSKTQSRAERLKQSGWVLVEEIQEVNKEQAKDKEENQIIQLLGGIEITPGVAV